MLVRIKVDWVLLHISLRQKRRSVTEKTTNSSCAGGNQNTARQSRMVAQVTTLDIASRRRMNTDWTLERIGRSDWKRGGEEGNKINTADTVRTGVGWLGNEHPETTNIIS